MISGGCAEKGVSDLTFAEKAGVGMRPEENDEACARLICCWMTDN